MSYQTTQEKPTAAYVLSLVGGILSIVGAVILMLIAAISLSAYYSYPYYSFYPIFAVLYVGIGAWLIISGAIVVIAASRLNANPEEHNKWGMLILIFSILGGGGIFGIIGGILALVWKPSMLSTPPPPPWQQASTLQQIKRICPQCGRVLTEEMKFCPYCGKELGG